MSVVTDYQELGPCSRKLSIEIPFPAVDAERGRVVRDLGRKVRIPGFRKGKVPPKLVEKRFGEDIQSELVERLIPRYLKQAEAEKELASLLPPQIQDLAAEPGEPLRFVALYEVRPALEVGELAPFELPDPAVEPADSEVDGALDDLRRSRSTWTMQERAAANGDRVTGVVHLPESEDGDGDEASEPLRFRVEIGGEGVDEKLGLSLVGAKAGGSVRVDELPGREEPGPYRLEIETVEERELPELDDALASEVGSFETVEDLRKAIEAQMRYSKQEERRAAREKAVLDELRSRFPLQLPERTVGQALERMLQEYAEHLMSRGVDLEAAEIPWEKVQQDLRPRAEERVHARLVLDAIADAQGVHVEESALEGFLARMAAREGMSSGALRQRMSQTGQLDSLRENMRRERLIRTLTGEDEATEATEATEADGGVEEADE